jgi:hypothetical protein
MMRREWSIVKKEHVLEACDLYDAGDCVLKSPARNTFLLYRNKRYPAKFIRGLAYELASGQKLNPKFDFEGGRQTADFLRRLGFKVDYQGKRLRSEIGNSA